MFIKGVQTGQGGFPVILSAGNVSQCDPEAIHSNISKLSFDKLKDAKLQRI